MMFYIAIFSILIIFGISLYTDVKEWKIKNVVTLPPALIGIVIALFHFSVWEVLLYIFVVFAVGIAGWLFNLWKAGDTKLILVTAVWSMFITGTNILFPLFYYLVFLGFYFLIGHFLGLKKYRFKLKQYLLSLKTKVNEQYGAIPATFVILCSFFMTFIVYYWSLSPQTM